jgi:hypothetical protein
VVPSRVDLARPLHGLALDQVNAEAVAEEPGVVFFGERVREEKGGLGEVRERRASRSKRKQRARRPLRWLFIEKKTGSVLAFSSALFSSFSLSCVQTQSAHAFEERGQKRSPWPRTPVSKKSQVGEKKTHLLRRRLRSTVKLPGLTSTRQSRRKTAS